MRKLVLGAALAVAVVIGVANPAAATRHGTATGTFTVLSENFTPIGTVGGDSFFVGHLTLAYQGGLTGSAADGETFVVHSDGTFEVRGIEVCESCTIGGRTGNFKAEFELTGGPSFTEFAGTLTFTCGSGGLEGLRGGGTFRGTDAGNTYSYRYRFARGQNEDCWLDSDEDDDD